MLIVIKPSITGDLRATAADDAQARNIRSLRTVHKTKEDLRLQRESYDKVATDDGSIRRRRAVSRQRATETEARATSISTQDHRVSAQNR